ncbi:MAG: 5'/3'-nucleotidase SurE [Bacteroidia bacterium]|nr:5'/3'-nucleotidase SurE [Bacteroidia bacterium]
MTKNKKPLILVTNDDGITASGLKVLVNAAKKWGEIVVVAPDSPQSGQGHAITLNHPLRIYEVDEFGDIEAYKCNGTPVDCVKLAKSVLLKDREIDLCLSGVNHGSNVAINILYSGTMSAAMEASLEGIPSIGFSITEFLPGANFEPYGNLVSDIVGYVIEKGMEHTKLLNINIPYIGVENIKGIKVCRQAEANWKEEYIANNDPLGRTYYWMSGVFENYDNGPDTDVEALENGYVSIVPCEHDLTAYKSFVSLKSIESIL